MDYPTIIEIVTSTKTLLLHPGNFSVSAKGRADFVTNVDVEVQRYLQEHLASLYPDVIMLAEEQERLTIEEDKAYWILDPIDGTQNFIRQMQCSAVSLAYYAEGSLQFGVIYNPFTDEVFHAVKDEGAFLGRTPLQVTKNATLGQSMVSIGTSPYDRQYTEKNWPFFQDVFSRVLDVRRSGSAALDLAYVAAGRLDGYVERNLKPWDMAAGLLLISEAGGQATNYHGELPDVNANEDICAGNGLINGQLLDLIKKHWPEL